MKGLRHSIVLFGILCLVAPLEGQGFGSTVAVTEGDVIIGEPMNVTQSGAAYVFRLAANGSWSETAKLMASDATVGDRFGRSMSADGNLLLVGSTLGGGPDSSGVAYVFERSASGSWSEVAVLRASDAAAGDGVGRTVALHGSHAFVSTWGQNEATGAVYVFERDASSGHWSEKGKLVGNDVGPGDRFGSSIAVEGNWALIGAPAKNKRSGAAYLFRRDVASGQWTQTAKLEGAGVDEQHDFGAAVAWLGTLALVGTPGFERGVGAVFSFALDDDSGEWIEQERLAPYVAAQRSGFGSSLAAQGSQVWVGAPLADQGRGHVFVFNRGPSSTWDDVRQLTGRDVGSRDLFASALAVGMNVAVAGISGDDYGAGTAALFGREGSGWTQQAKLLSEVKGLDPITGGEVQCAEGTAALFECSEVDIVSFLPVQAIGGGRGVRVNDLWGWTDPETGREYALVGRLDGTSFIDVSDAGNPVYLGNLPKTASAPGSTWRDIKVYKDHAFIVADGALDHGMQVFDLSQLRNVSGPPVTFSETAHYDGIHSAHNIVINEETGFAFAVGARAGGETCGGGLHMINIQTPDRPTFAGCFADPSTGRRKTGYSHDAQCVSYRGPDMDHQGKEICLGSNETALSIADVTDKSNPIALAMASYPNVGYSHQGWLTEDHKYFFMNDELDELGGNVDKTRTLIWDVTDLDDPVLMKEHLSDINTSDHNLYIRGNLMYQSNYVSGLHVFDISDVENPVEVAYFDTVPYGEDAPGFNGSWSNYPYFDSGIVVVTSGREGVFILKKRPQEIIP